MGVFGYKALKVGQNILGVIRTVNDFDLVISLPNQLTGFVSCLNISPTLSSLFSGISTGETPIGASLPTLKDYYQVGEIVSCNIQELINKENGKRRIDLSMRPKQVNQGMKADVIVENIVMSGELISREDRGWMVSFHLEGKADIVGFLPFSEIRDSTLQFKEGKTCLMVTSTSFKEKKNRVVSLSVQVESFVNSEVNNENIESQSLTCGSKVIAKIMEIEKGRSLVVSVGDHLAKIDVMNLPEQVMLKRHKEFDLEEHFPVGKNITARIISVDKTEKHLWLCARHTIVNWSPVTSLPKLGEKVADCRVTRIDPNIGLMLVMTDEMENPFYGYTHISRASDTHIKSLESTFQVGTRKPGKLLDIDLFTGLYAVSLKKSDIESAITRMEDLHPGQIVRGTVAKVESYGAIISISDRVRVLCPSFHLSETQSDLAQKSLTVGSKYKFRVLEVDQANRKAIVTKKKGLLESQYPILSDFSQAKVGNYHDGFISAIHGYGCIVKFFGNIRGLVPVSEMCDEYVDSPQDSFFVGQVVRCRIVEVTLSSECNQIRLSFRESDKPKTMPASFKRARKEAKGATEEVKKVNIEVDA